ncbi:hypothetical protein J3R82DRAFT_6956 [Butyriboletus roseoflavus]|nr:hypothetical protein J3R82DRAFT_6956 [Butyriboletus roseoflavus]
MLSTIPFPALPTPPSWFPGHMNRFTKQLPALLSRTDVVLELRDARLPLTSINHNLESESQVPALALFFFHLVVIATPQFERWYHMVNDSLTPVTPIIGQPHDDSEAPESEFLSTEAAICRHVLGWVTVMTNHLLARSDKKMESGTRVEMLP